MDNLFTALILSIVEGLTEFLPVSSSGHLILVGDLLNFSGEKAARIAAEEWLKGFADVSAMQFCQCQRNDTSLRSSFRP